MAPLLDRVFNPQMLTVARQARGLSQKELAEAAQVTQGYVSKLENGLADPAHDVLVRLAGVLSYPVEMLYRREEVIGVPASFARKLERVPKRVYERISAELNIRRFNLGKLLHSVELDAGRELPLLDPDEHGSPEEVARKLRFIWRVPSGPIRNLVELIEDAGAVLVPCDFGVPDIDAVAQIAPGMPPVVFYSVSAPADRLRFTLAHELGHVVMHRIPTEKMEEEADRFAVEFLMPAADIAASFAGDVTLAKLAALKQVWRVSMMSLLRRAHALKKVSASRYRQLAIQMSAAGYKKREPPETDISREEPRTFRDLLAAYTDELGYTVHDIASLLTLHAPELRQSYMLERPHLRLMAS